MAALFPPWANTATHVVLVAIAVTIAGVLAAPMMCARSPFATGQADPVLQPILFDHRHHVRDDGIDCLYCHEDAEHGPYAGVPAAERCMGCHNQIWNDSQLIAPLVNPAAGQGFHVVAPSLPGYAFSTPLSAAGWTMGRTARAWAELMRLLGYRRYGVHGGDIGAGVSGMVAGLDRDHVIGMHVVTDPLTAAATATFLPGMADRLDRSDPVD